MNTALATHAAPEIIKQESAHTVWLRSEMERSLADPRPKVPHDEVMRKMEERIARWEKKVPA